MTGKEFRIKRNLLDLKQAELAERLGLNANTVSRYENEDLPIPKTVELAMDALELQKYRIGPGTPAAIKLILELTLGIESDYKLEPDLASRLRIIEALAKHKYDVRNPYERELMEQLRAKNKDISED
ncbi:MAG TPA: helix-turn-helix domain-containing protein [Sphingobacteriaceae bacterium]